METPRTLPASWIDRIFSRLQGLYGTLWVDRWKTGEQRRLPTGQVIDVGMLNAKAIWAAELAGFAARPEVIGHALGACDGLRFPPTLPEFLRLCREEAARPASVVRLSHTSAAGEIARQREAVARIAEAVRQRTTCADPLAWAARPRSQTAMNALWREGRHRGNRVLGAILDDHIANGICSDAGRLLKRWDGEKWVPA